MAGKGAADRGPRTLVTKLTEETLKKAPRGPVTEPLPQKPTPAPTEGGPQGRARGLDSQQSQVCPSAPLWARWGLLCVRGGGSPHNGDY